MLPGVISARVWVREDQRGTGNPPGHSVRAGEAQGGDCHDGGGSARRESLACARACRSGLNSGR